MSSEIFSSGTRSNDLFFSGARYFVDEETGFLTTDPRETGANLKYALFRASEKVAWLKLAESLWPNITEICKRIGISRNTYVNHSKIDKAFAEAVEEIQEKWMDSLEAKQVEEALTGKQGFLSRISTLRAYRPERWREEHKIVHETQVPEQEGRAWMKLQNVVDAEFIPPEILEGELDQEIKDSLKKT